MQRTCTSVCTLKLSGRTVLEKFMVRKIDWNSWNENLGENMIRDEK